MVVEVNKYGNSLQKLYIKNNQHLTTLLHWQTISPIRP